MNPEYVGSHPAPRSAHPHAGLAVPTTTILGSWLTTTDHKRIGILYGVSAFVFFLIGGVEALIIRAQLARPGLTLVTADTYNELFTMHGTTMVFLAIMPFGSAFFNYMVPLQIGARDVAFPRLNALSFWMFLAGGILLHTSFLAGTPPAVGWFAYANLTRREYSPNLGVDFWTLSLQVLGASSILAAFGIVSEVLPTFARKPLFGAPVVIYSGVLIGFFGFGVWGHHMFAAGMGPVADSAFAIATMLIAIPTGVKIFNWLATLWGGRIHGTTALHFAAGLIATFTIGGLSGIMHSSPPVDLQQTDTYFVVAHLHYVLIGGSLFGLLAGAYYWWPKITGRLLDERLGRLQFWLIFVAFNLTFFPQHYLGAVGMPRRIYTYRAGAGWDLWNFVSSVGAFGIGLGILLFMVNAVRSLRTPATAPGDPWDGRTLEWRTSSPPPAHNFDAIPPVYGRDSFWREKHGPQRTPLAPPVAEHGIHLPAPSHWPIVLACGVFVAAVGALVHLAWVILGGLLALWAAISFALEHHRNPAHEHQVGVLGIDHRKVGIWTFIGSECLFFGTLIATYIAYKGRSVVRPPPHEILNIPITSASTFDLLMSSLLMVLALAAVQRGDRRQSRLWLAGTAFFGLIFLGFQAYEFTSFVHEGLTLQQSLFGSTFFVLTGFHGAHVALGVLWLVTLLVLDLRGRLGVADSVKVEIAGLYWHFVDIVWIVIFTLVYLVP